MVSPSVRGCGLKSMISPATWATPSVTLRARVWVEIAKHSDLGARSTVTLRARVWVEIVVTAVFYGLGAVTLRARVWVEIPG